MLNINCSVRLLKLILLVSIGFFISCSSTRNPVQSNDRKNDVNSLESQKFQESIQTLNINTQDVINYKKPVNLIKNKSEQIEKIVFIDTTNQSIISEYNLKENDPLYSKLGISPVKVKSNETYGYKVERIPIGSLMSQEHRLIYSIQAPDSTPVTGAYIMEKVFDNQENFVIIVNTASLMNDDVTFAAISTISVLHKNGKPYLTLVDSNLCIEQATITADGKYLGCIYGFEDQWGKLMGFNYRITNLSNGTTIIDKPIDSKFFHFNITSKNNLISVLLQRTMESATYIIFKMDENAQFIGEFSWDQYIRIERIEDEGFIIKTSSGEFQKIYYKQDFTIKNIIQP